MRENKKFYIINESSTTWPDSEQCIVMGDSERGIQCLVNEAIHILEWR